MARDCRQAKRLARGSVRREAGEWVPNLPAGRFDGAGASENGTKHQQWNCLYFECERQEQKTGGMQRKRRLNKRGV